MSRVDEASPPVSQPGIPWLVIAAVTATVSVFAVAQGLSYPLLTYILERQGISPTLIGISAAMTPLGMTVASTFVPRLVNRVGGLMMVIVCSLFCTILFGLIGAVQNVWTWLPLRFLLGTAVIPLYIQSEVWMLTLAPARARGRLMGTYTALMSLGFALGPLTLVLVGSDGWKPFFVGACAFLLCSGFVVAVGPRLPHFEADNQRGSISRFMPAAPTLLLAVAVSAGFKTAMISLFPSYGKALSLGEASVSTLLTVFIIGNFALQMPLGLMADRWSARSTLIVCSITAAMGCLLLPIAVGSISLWPLMFFWGAFAHGIYTMAVVELGRRFAGSTLIAGNAAFALMWGVGGIVVPPGAGLAMHLLGSNGLLAVLGMLCSLLAVVAVFRASWPG